MITKLKKYISDYIKLELVEMQFKEYYYNERKTEFATFRNQTIDHINKLLYLINVNWCINYSKFSCNNKIYKSARLLTISDVNIFCIDSVIYFKISDTKNLHIIRTEILNNTCIIFNHGYNIKIKDFKSSYAITVRTKKETISKNFITFVGEKYFSPYIYTSVYKEITELDLKTLNIDIDIKKYISTSKEVPW